MQHDLRDKPNVLPWPPLIYSIALVIAWGLERWDPFSWLDERLVQVPVSVGLAVFCLGMGLDLWAFLTLRRKKTTVLPNAKSSALVTTGPYRFSRNPIYLGNTFAVVGLALALHWGWLLLLVPVTIAAVGWLAISREERHLELRFGTDWRDYAARVRRWL